MLEVLLGFRRDIPTSPFPLEFGDEPPGYCHSSSIGQLAGGFDPAYTLSFSSLAARKAIFLPRRRTATLKQRVVAFLATASAA